VERQVAFEAEKEVLAMCVDAAHTLPGKPVRPAIHRMSRLWRLYRDDLLPDQGCADPPGGRVDRVPLRH
jgi:hypothetical protein